MGLAANHNINNGTIIVHVNDAYGVGVMVCHIGIMAIGSDYNANGNTANRKVSNNPIAVCINGANKALTRYAPARYIGDKSCPDLGWSQALMGTDILSVSE